MIFYKACRFQESRCKLNRDALTDMSIVHRGLFALLRIHSKEPGLPSPVARRLSLAAAVPAERFWEGATS
jgi:hypothetical protein